MSITVKKVYEFDIRTDCWSGAKERVDSLTPDLVDRLDDMLDDSGLWGDDLPSDTDVNDFIWFEDDTYCEWLGFPDVNTMWTYCDLINGGVDEDDLWLNDDGELVTYDDLVAAYTNYDDEDGDYTDAVEWAEDNGWEKFEL